MTAAVQHDSWIFANLWLIPLYPLASAAVMLLLGRRLPKAVVSMLCVGSVGLAFAHSLSAVINLISLPASERVIQVTLFRWLPASEYLGSSGALKSFFSDWGMLLDPLSSVMILVVTGVGLLIHIYSIGYMAHEGGYYRFFGYMNLFMFSMLTLVLADNFLLLFVGWEGVGTCSYLLIGFYFHKKSAGDAGKKAFIVNRIGDSGFLLGIFLCSAALGTIKFTEIPGAISAAGLGIGAPVLTGIALLLFVGATGKSAQLPLYTWLPDAMEGPTPVSALIHAATMVTAGVYMVTRANPIFQLSPLALEVVTVIGILTALFAATMGVLQNDIKRVLAYSTISQLGYMFLACGVGAYVAAVFHLMTHAFFKALLFLASGSVIHAMGGEQDMRKMGGLWSKIPVTARTMLIGAVAIAGIPPLAGFFSKDGILWKTFSLEADTFFKILWAVGLFTAGLTAFYMFRLICMTFFGPPQAGVPHDVEHHIHESPRSMTIPLIVLAALSVIGGWIGIPKALGGGAQFERFLEPVVHQAAMPAGEHSIHTAQISEAAVAASAAGEAAHHDSTEYFLMVLSVAVALAGIGLAWNLYKVRPEIPARIAASWPRAYNLVYNKYYVDQLYDALFVNRAKDLGLTFWAFDRNVIDGFGVDGSAWLTRVTSRISIWWDKWIVDGLVNFTGFIIRAFSVPVRMLQGGRVQGYALWIVVGVGLLWFMGYYMLR